MENPEIRIECQLIGKAGKYIVTVFLNDEVIETDEIKLLKKEHRAKFAKQLCNDRPGLDRENVMKSIDECAAEAVNKNHSSKSSSNEDAAKLPRPNEYIETEDGVFHLKRSFNDTSKIQLTNFKARILSDIVHDNGQEKERIFDIEVTVAGATKQFEIPTNRFQGMSWVTEQLGPGAIVYAGSTTKDHARVAIQQLSDGFETKQVFVHTGWRKMESGDWYFLHGGGAIGTVGTVGTVKEIDINLNSEIFSYHLPTPLEGEERTEAIQTTLEFLDLAPHHITYPLFASVWRAALGGVDFAMHLSGPTGSFKTEIAALLQSFFGKDFDSRNLPGTWSSTENSLEELAFLVKDTILVIDDFAPHGSKYDVQRYHRKADRVIRAVGNHSARGRLNADSTHKKSHPPRCLIVSTGEDVPVGQSLQARMLIFELSSEDITSERLTERQSASQEGMYAQAMSCFLQALANQFETVKARFTDISLKYRKFAATEGQHRRTPTIIAELQAAFDTFIDFAYKAGAIDEKRVKELRKESWKALHDIAERQTAFQTSSEPTQVFINLLRAAVTAGKAYVADKNGEVPEKCYPEALGWEQISVGTGGYKENKWQHKGMQIAWIEDNYLYLDPTSAFKAAQEMESDCNRLSITQNSLIKRLVENGYVVERDEARQRNTVRVTLQGQRREVLKLRNSILILPSQPSQLAQEEESEAKNNDLRHFSPNFNANLWDGHYFSRSTTDPMNSSTDNVPRVAESNSVVDASKDSPDLPSSSTESPAHSRNGYTPCKSHGSSDDWGSVDELVEAGEVP